MSHRYDVTILTYRDFPNLYPDDVPLREALERQGATVRAAVWDDPAVDWSQSRATVFRSTWDYHESPDEFRAWVDRNDSLTTLINSAAIVRWNMDKRYLVELAARGFPCIPSAMLERGQTETVEALAHPRDWHDVVVKPAISAASVGAKRFREDFAGAQQHADALREAGRDAIVQPYLEEVATAGEHALIFAGAQFSHAVRKVPFHGIPVKGDDPEPRIEPEPKFVALATRIVASLDETPAYARIDLVPTSRGPLLMELELIEPSLYFRLDATYADRLATEILARSR